MWSKKFFNIILIAIIATTMLPLKQVGSLLFKNQITEELSEGCNSSLEKEVKPELKHFYHFHHYIISVSEKQTASIKSCYWFASRLPVSPSCDVHCPPPNIMF